MTEHAGPRPLSVGVCGLYCGACVVWRASHDRADVFRPELAEGTGWQPCGGCRSGVVQGGCASCDKRACAYERGLVSCADCPELGSPCERLAAFRHYRNRPHLADIMPNLAVIKASGERAWAIEQRKRWACANCGEPYAWYSPVCPACGGPVRAFTWPPNAS